MDLKGYTKGERVKLLREVVGMSQKELAEMIGTSSPAISMIETGKKLDEQRKRTVFRYAWSAYCCPFATFLWRDIMRKEGRIRSGGQLC